MKKRQTNTLGGKYSNSILKKDAGLGAEEANGAQESPLKDHCGNTQCSKREKRRRGKPFRITEPQHCWYLRPDISVVRDCPQRSDEKKARCFGETGCLAHPWPLPIRCQQQAFFQTLPVVSCGKNCPQLKSTGLDMLVFKQNQMDLMCGESEQ